MTKGFPDPIADFFRLTADAQFRNVIGQVTGIDGILDDPDLIGGGLHQITRGGFLDVHIDFNLHPRTKQHRRLNLLHYLNENWKNEYEGHLELWDMKKDQCIERVAPILNRAVLFETNEVSYHGHPRPLMCPPEMSRRSAAVYYYTEQREFAAPEHNTVYRQTTGAHGYLKTMRASLTAVRERFQREGLLSLSVDVGDKAYRRLRGLPPRNA
jgi:hypothetical protein